MISNKGKKVKKVIRDKRAKGLIDEDVKKEEKGVDPLFEEAKCQIKIFLENKRRRFRDIESKKYQLKISRIDEDIAIEQEKMLVQLHEKMYKKILWKKLLENRMDGNKKNE